MDPHLYLRESCSVSRSSHPYIRPIDHTFWYMLRESLSEGSYSQASVAERVLIVVVIVASYLERELSLAMLTSSDQLYIF